MKRLLLILSLLSCRFLSAQTDLIDTSFTNTSRSNAISIYQHFIASKSILFNGSDYPEYQSLDGEHPYFIDLWLKGTVNYDGEKYNSVPLLFDIHKGKLITENPYTGVKIQLVSELVEQFVIDNHLFIKIKNPLFANTFCELAYNGPAIQVIVKRQKDFQRRISGKMITQNFEEKTGYYIRKDSSFIFVRNKKKLMALFSDRKQEMKEFTQHLDIRFKSNKTLFMCRMAAYYDQLKSK